MALRELTPLRIASVPPPADARVVTDIYRPFFIAGIVSVLTAGCTLGAIALVGLALQQSFTANVWTPFVLAHANSQLYGWVGFFVMGFALQQHAPRQSRAGLFYRLATWSLCLMASGIVLRFFAEPLVSTGRAVWLPVGILSAMMQLAAVTLFLANTTLTRYKNGEGLAWQTKFVFASLAWLVTVSMAEPTAFLMGHQESALGSQAFVAEWMSPLRDAQFLGFVANMIFGVALVKMHSCFGAKAASRSLGNAAFLCWNGGLILRIAGWVQFSNHSFGDGADLTYRAGGALLVVGAALFVASSRMFGRLANCLPSHKFVRAAFGWLLVAGALVVLEPWHLGPIGMPFSHAFTGAIRHALTVGFISQMIIGVGTHVISRMNDLPEEKQRALWATFWLLNLGNAGRVGLEIAIDYTPSAYGPMGMTGFVELVGLAIWGILMVSIMLRHRQKGKAYA